MIDALRRPLEPPKLLLASVALLTVVTVYCLAYNRFAGQAESPLDGVVWTSVHILPWLFAFEAAKRRIGVGGPALIMLIALATSMVLGFLTGAGGNVEFELVRRLPGLLLTALLLILTRASVESRNSKLRKPNDLPLLPEQIDWVAAAGNYVEIHADRRTVLHRASLSLVEAELSQRGFIRIHRSILVHRDYIQRVSGDNVLLKDGTCVRSGKRYRHALRQFFVPSSQRSGKQADIAP